MKVKNPSTGNFEEVYVKALDSLPVGSEIDFTGSASDIPVGWEESDDIIVNTQTSSTSKTYSCNYIDAIPKLEIKGSYFASGDLNNATEAGIYWCSGSPTNSPYANGFLMVLHQGSWTKQIFFRAGTVGTNDFNTAVRTGYNGNWSSWKIFAMTS